MVGELLAAWALIGLVVLVLILFENSVKGGEFEGDWLGYLTALVVVIGWPYVGWLMYKHGYLK